MLEELDTPGEWFYDRAAGMLYYYPQPGIDMATATVEAALLKELVSIKGSAAGPVHHVHFEHITFAHAARTILAPYENLLRGDWSIARKGAMFIEGAEDCSVEHCEFDAVGGNAVFLSNYCRRVNVTGCRITQAGESGICLVGNPGAVRCPSAWENHIADPLDKTPGPLNSNYPAKCVIENNLIHSIGEVGKQTAGVFISMAEEITVRHNSIYNLPRAGICINDGTWGGHLIEANDVFATVQETGDHGPFNSWGRDRHWTSLRKDLAFLDNWKTTIIRNNRFAHWGNHSWGIDLDDGSSNYKIYENLTLGCSFKLREGYNRTVENNICIGPFPPGKHCCLADNDDVVRRNILVSTSDGCMWEMIYGNPKFAKEMDYNLFWNTKQGAPVVRLTGTVPDGFKGEMTMEEWKTAGFEQHSIFADPGFIDPAMNDFRVKSSSGALAFGFKNFAMDDFGVINDAYRKEAEEGHRKHDRAREEVLKALTAPVQAERGEKKNLRSATPHVWLGATLKNLIGWGEMSATGMSAEKGVLVTEVPKDSKAAKVGLKASDVILGVNGKAVDSWDDFKKAMDKAKGEMKVSVSRKQKTIEINFGVTQ